MSTTLTRINLTTWRVLAKYWEANAKDHRVRVPVINISGTRRPAEQGLGYECSPFSCQPPSAYTLALLLCAVACHRFHPRFRSIEQRARIVYKTGLGVYSYQERVYVKADAQVPLRAVSSLILLGSCYVGHREAPPNWTNGISGLNIAGLNQRRRQNSDALLGKMSGLDGTHRGIQHWDNPGYAYMTEKSTTQAHTYGTEQIIESSSPRASFRRDFHLQSRINLAHVRQGLFLLATVEYEFCAAIPFSLSATGASSKFNECNVTASRVVGQVCPTGPLPPDLYASSDFTVEMEDGQMCQRCFAYGRIS
ncbi:hypothetical protein BDQ17DRAFT_1328183 [Cyathus striatus]|nr:hypothetical protein BDQ17DRAFT_1328183 [Cyathus striatus]